MEVILTMIHAINSPPPLSADTDLVPASTSPLDCPTDVNKGARSVAIYNIPIITIIPINNERNEFLFAAITGAAIKYVSAGRSVNGKSLFPGSTTARSNVIGTMTIAIVMISLSPSKTAKSIPMLTFLPGNFLLMKLCAAFDSGLNPSISIFTILGNMNMTAAIPAPAASAASQPSPPISVNIKPRINPKNNGSCLLYTSRCV